MELQQYAIKRFTKANGFALDTLVVPDGRELPRVNYNINSAKTVKIMLDFMSKYRLELIKFNGFFVLDDKVIVPRELTNHDESVLGMLLLLVDEFYANPVKIGSHGNMVVVETITGSAIGLIKQGNLTKLYLKVKGKVYFEDHAFRGWSEEYYLLQRGLTFIYRIFRDNVIDIEEEKKKEYTFKAVADVTKALTANNTPADKVTKTTAVTKATTVAKATKTTKTAKP